MNDFDFFLNLAVQVRVVLALYNLAMIWLFGDRTNSEARLGVNFSRKKMSSITVFEY